MDISRRRHDVALLLSVLGVPRDLYQECSRWPGMDYVVSVIDSYIIATLHECPSGSRYVLQAFEGMVEFTLVSSSRAGNGCARAYRIARFQGRLGRAVAVG